MNKMKLSLYFQKNGKEFSVTSYGTKESCLNVIQGIQDSCCLITGCFLSALEDKDVKKED